LKILYLHRSKEFGGYSFEELFTTIKNNIKNCEIVDFYDKTFNGFFKNISAVKKINTDLYHITGGIGYYSIFLPTKKTILTIHDTNHYEEDLKGLKKWVFGYLIYKLPYSNSKFITVVSNHTKNRLIKLFKFNPNKIRVIPNCYPINFKYSEKKTDDSIFKILQIGTKKIKNLERLIFALEGLNVELTIIGKVNNKISTLLKENDINWVNKFDLNQEEIYTEYKNTDLVTLISLCEGFGLPIIEAQVIGRPVITSNKCSMPEVANDSAHIVDPYNIEEIRFGIEKIINDDNYRNLLIEKGLKNAANYSPNHIASLYENLYQEILNIN
tara:strand:- start:912 stop:1892 length:981 start_codon:yes stop_codon:yes gene_type:complete